MELFTMNGSKIIRIHLVDFDYILFKEFEFQITTKEIRRDFKGSDFVISFSKDNLRFDENQNYNFYVFDQFAIIN